MQTNVEVVERLYRSLDQHAAGSRASCYHPEATFRDIASDLRGKDSISDTWSMICATDITATLNVLHADDASVTVMLVDDYTFSETGRRVRNVIESRFRFRDGLIGEHVDTCDARLWGAMALGGIGGLLAGRVGLLRRISAARLLRNYQREHAG